MGIRGPVFTAQSQHAEGSELLYYFLTLLGKNTRTQTEHKPGGIYNVGLFSHAVGGHRPHWAKVKVSEGCLLQEGPGENLLLAYFWGPPGPLGSWPLPPSCHPLLFDRISPPLLLIVPPP